MRDLGTSHWAAGQVLDRLVPTTIVGFFLDLFGHVALAIASDCGSGRHRLSVDCLGSRCYRFSARPDISSAAEPAGKEIVIRAAVKYTVKAASQPGSKPTAKSRQSGGREAAAESASSGSFFGTFFDALFGALLTDIAPKFASGQPGQVFPLEKPVLEELLEHIVGVSEVEPEV